MGMLTRRLGVVGGCEYCAIELLRILGVDELGTYTPRGAPVVGAPQPYEG
jgi:hypothetical protein